MYAYAHKYAKEKSLRKRDVCILIKFEKFLGCLAEIFSDIFTDKMMSQTERQSRNTEMMVKTKRTQKQIKKETVSKNERKS